MIIDSRYINFSQISDPIKTEEVIYNKLKNIDINFNYVSIPLAFSINHFGIEKTQNFVDEINSKHNEKKVFVCQHIFVNKIDFGDNYVFTPHTTNSDKFFFIPHYNPIYENRKIFKKTSERELNFSFIGDYSTNILRELISNINLDKCIYESTGKWFFSQDLNAQDRLKNKYINVIENTKFPLCPPGTGPSTLRLFESLSSGGIPIIFNDLKLPDDLNNLIIKTDIEKLINGEIYKFIENDFDFVQNKILDTYWSNYSNENLHMSIIKKFN